jgi:hypothetical protein
LVPQQIRIPTSAGCREKLNGFSVVSAEAARFCDSQSAMLAAASKFAYFDCSAPRLPTASEIKRG